MPPGKPHLGNWRFSPNILWLVWLAFLVTDQKASRSAGPWYVGKIFSEESWQKPQAQATKVDSRTARAAHFLSKFRNPTSGYVPSGARAKEIAFGQVVKQQQFREFQSSSFHILSRGPFNIGGRTRALGIDIRDDATLLAAGVSGGMWRSSDAGTTWQYVTRPDQVPSVSCVLQDTRPGKEDTWYYGTGELFGNTASSPGAPYRGDGVFKSENNGNSWEQLPATITQRVNSPLASSSFNHVNSLALDASNLLQDELYAAVPYGILRTTDGFDSWTEVLGERTGLINGRWTEVISTPEGVLYATISNEQGFQEGVFGIFRSEDGINWTDITPPTGYEGRFRRVVMAYAPSQPQTVYFMGDVPQGTQLHVYNDQTNSWADLSKNIPQYGGVVGNFNTQNSYNMVVAVHPTQPKVVFLGATNLYVSSDGFATNNKTKWIGGFSTSNDLNQYPGHHADQHVLKFGASEQLVSGHDGGISVSTNYLENFVKWTTLNHGYQTGQAYAVSQSHLNSNDGLRVAGFQDNASYLTRGVDLDTPWLEAGTADGGYNAISPSSVIVSWQYGQLRRYAFDPTTGLAIPGAVARLSIPQAGSSDQFAFLTPWKMDPIRPNRLFVGGNAGVWYQPNIARDNPNTWRLVGNEGLVGNISALDISQSEPHLWVGTDLGKLYMEENHLQPQAKFVDKSSPLFPTNGYISSIAVHPSRPNEIWVCFSNYGVQSVFRTQDMGETWMAVSGNLEENPEGNGAGPAATWISIAVEGNTTHYFLGTSIGLFHTTQPQGMGTAWQIVGEDIIGWALIDMIDINPVDGTVVIATHGKGVFEFRIPNIWKPRLMALGSTQLCNGIAPLLIATRDVSDPNRYEYQWFLNNQRVLGQTQATLEVSSEGQYTVEVTDTHNGTKDTSNSVQLFGTIPRVIDVLLEGDTLRVSPPCLGCQYTWVRDDADVIAITNTPKLFIGDAYLEANYKVSVSNGCAPVESKTVSVNGISLEANQTDVLVAFPNPVLDETELALLKPTQTVTGARLLSAQGQVLGEQLSGEWKHWDLRSLPSGSYIMQVFGDGFSTSTVVVKK